MKILQRIHPILLVVIAMFSVQWGAALAKSLFAEFGAITVVFWRVALGAVMLLIIVRPALRAPVRWPCRRALAGIQKREEVSENT